MKITVFGATGKVGRLVVDNLLSSGHQVTAFAHGASPFTPTKNLTVVQGDIHNAGDVKAALAGSDAIISTLGSWHTLSEDILTSAMKNIIPVAETQGIKRLVSLTGSQAALPDEKLRLFERLFRFALTIIAHKILVDGENHLRLLAASQLDWTVIRSPIMKTSAKTGYRLSLAAPSPVATVSRAAVAQAITDQLQAQDYIKMAPHIQNAPPENTRSA